MKILQILSYAAIVWLPSLQALKQCSNEERNWDFSNNTYGWIGMGNYTSELMKEVGSDSMVLAVKNRKHHYAGPSQNLDKDCYNTGDKVEVSVKIKLYTQQDDVTEVYGYNCDIKKHWAEDEGNDGIDTGVCPALTLRLMKSGKATKHIDIADMVPPYKIGAYNTLYGEFIITQEMMDADSMTIYFSKAESMVNMYIEHVSLVTVNEGDKCGMLISNGDGESGNAKGWSQYGPSGTVDTIQHDLSVGVHSIWSRYRTHWNSGIKVILDQGCLELGSLYELKALVHMRYSGKSIGCDYTLTDTRNQPERCPVASVGAYNTGGPLQHRQVASATGPWVQEEFNEIKGSFSFFKNEIAATQLTVFFNLAPVNVDIIIDEVTLTMVRNAESFL